MKWTAKLISSSLPACPVYWNLTHDSKDGVRLTINIYKADRATLKAAKEQVEQLIKKLNS